MTKATVYIQSIRLIGDGIPLVHQENGILEITNGLDLGLHDRSIPYLTFYAKSDHEMEGVNISSTVSLSGYAEIDAIRRYCEMTLEHYDKGLLE